MQLTSPAFGNHSTIPKKYGYNNGNISPPLNIEDIPCDTKSLVLIMEDPDALKAVGKIWIHWLVWNISPNSKNFLENNYPQNSIKGINDFGEIGYGGPAPPDKMHQYVFKLYALNTTLDLKEGSSKIELEEKIKDHIISETELLGNFSPC